MAKQKLKAKQRRREPWRDEIDAMSVEQLEELLGIADGNPRVCIEVGCFNETADGYAFCLQCLNGVSERADERLVAAKRRLAKLKQREARQ